MKLRGSLVQKRERAGLCSLASLSSTHSQLLCHIPALRKAGCYLSPPDPHPLLAATPCLSPLILTVFFCFFLKLSSNSTSPSPCPHPHPSFPSVNCECDYSLFSSLGRHAYQYAPSIVLNSDLKLNCLILSGYVTCLFS